MKDSAFRPTMTLARDYGSMSVALATVALSAIGGASLAVADNNARLILAGVLGAAVLLVSALADTELALNVFAVAAVNLAFTGLQSDLPFAVTPDLIVTPLLVLAFLMRLARDRAPLLSAPFARLYMAFLLISVLTIPSNPAGLYGPKALLRFVTYYVICVTVAHVVQSRNGVLRLVRSCLLSALIPLAVSAYQTITQTGEVVYIPGLETVTRVKATTGGSYTYSFYLVIVILVALSFVRDLPQSRQGRLALYTLIAACYASLILTYIRGAWLAFVAGLLVIAVLRYRWILLALPVTIVSSLVAFPSIGIRLATILTQNDTSTERLILWQYAIQIFPEQPLLGHGIYAFEFGLTTRLQEILPVFNASDSPHNEYLQFLVDSGILGFAAFYGCIMVALYLGWRLYRTAQAPDLQSVGLAFLASEISLLVGGLTQNPLSSQPAVSVYFWLLLGLVLTSSAIEKRHRGDSIQARADMIDKASDRSRSKLQLHQI